MAEVGAIYVSVMPTTDGISKAISKEVDGGINEGSTKGEKSFGRSVGKWVKGAALATAAAAGLVAGVALKGGLERALNIEDAQAKLKGLGHDVETVEQIMTNALASVKGTAFGLDEAATTAASAVAAGIKPGQELEKYLKLTADAATIAGTSMGEMGGIINKVTATGKVSAENMNQLAERGIPIYQWLAEEYGVTQEALSDMVRKGEVDAETYRKVIEENIGGAALASGDTTRGAFANMMSSLSRIGANFLSGVFPMFKEGIGGITSLLEPLEGKAKDVGGAFGDWVGKAGEVWESFKETGIPELLGYLSPLALIFESMAPHGEALGAAVERIGAAMGDGLEEILPVLAGLFEDIAIEVGKLVAEDILPTLVEVVEILADALETAAPGFADMVEEISPLIPKVFELLDPLLAVVPPLAALVATLFSDTGEESSLPAVLDAVGGALDILAGILDWVGGLWGDLFKIIDDFLQFVNGDLSFAEWREELLGMGGPIGEVMRFADELGRNIKTFAADAGRNIVNFASGVGTKLGEVGTFFTNLPSKIMTSVAGFGTMLVDSGKALIQGFIDGIKKMLGPVGTAIGGIIDFAAGFFPNSPAKRGPLSGSGWTKLGKSGGALVEQFGSGLDPTSLTPSLSQIVTAPLSVMGGRGSSGGAMTGNLYLDSGEFLGVIRGEVSEIEKSDSRYMRRGRQVV